MMFSEDAKWSSSEES